MANSNHDLSSTPEAPPEREYPIARPDIGRPIQPILVNDSAITGPEIIAHILESFFCLLATVLFASVAAFQTKWHIGVSGLSGFAVVLSGFNFALSAFLLLVPLAARAYHNPKPLARWLKQYRVAFVCIGWGTTTTFLMAFATMVSAVPQPGCRDPNKDPHADLGVDFRRGLPKILRNQDSGIRISLVCYQEWRRRRHAIVTGASPDSPRARLSVELGQPNEQGQGGVGGGDTSTMRSMRTADPSVAASLPTTRRATASLSRRTFSISHTQQSSATPQTLYSGAEEGPR